MQQAAKSLGGEIVEGIKRSSCNKYSFGNEGRRMLNGLCGEDRIAELCHREGFSQSIKYNRSKDVLEVGKKRPAGDMVRAAALGEVKDLRRKAQDLKDVVAEQMLVLWFRRLPV
jgi:transposase